MASGMQQDARLSTSRVPEPMDATAPTAPPFHTVPSAHAAVALPLIACIAQPRALAFR